MKKYTLATLTLAALAAAPAFADVRLPSIFSEHMVLQRGPSVPVWGQADPGEQVKVSLGGIVSETQTGADGKWRLALNLAEALEGPHILLVEGKNRIEIQDVLLGEVWLCSGQSNMAFSMIGEWGAKQEIAKERNTRLRHFYISGPVSRVPLDHCPGKWVVAEPSTLGDFTAVGYYFGKSLTQSLGCAVGLINATCGGTPVEAWTSYEGLSSNPQLKASTDLAIEQWQTTFPRDAARYAADFAAWEAKQGRQDAGTKTVESCDVPKWSDVTLPGKIASFGLPDAGAVWLRKTIQVDPDASKWWALDLATPSGINTIYLNGVKVGETKATPEGLAERNQSVRYVIPNSALRKGANTLLIRLFSNLGDLGIAGNEGRFRLEFQDGTIPLKGPWEAGMERELPPLSAEARAEIPALPAKPGKRAGDVGSWWYNAKVYPIVSYGIRGVIWYQGEANVERAYQYREAFPLLIADWRKQWGRGDFPFYFCQLPNFGAKNSEPKESFWAELREAQSLALKMPHTGMAVLMDIGEARNIHPRNKKDAGERLAAVALAQTYGKEIPCSGPVYAGMSIEKNRIRLAFQQTEGGLVAQALPADYIQNSSPMEKAPLVRNSPGSQLEGFAICGEDRVWHWAEAKIDGTAILVESPAVNHPVAVRYAWADNPTCNLYNRAGFPAAPFRTDDFPASTVNAKY
ncbi:MAG: sialate O-acetylesterase [Chthoniobacteraceae bacterium]